MDNRERDLVTGTALARNVLWNLLGTGLPMVVALVAIPILVQALGTPRFGVLTLAWIVVGYFSLFDLGLGRALTKLVAERLGNQSEENIPELVWTANCLMAVLGLFGAVLVASMSSWLTSSVLNIPADLQQETRGAFLVLALSIPVVIGSTGLRGVLEAYQRFDLVNAVRIPLGAMTFLAPLLVLPFANNLVVIVAALTVARLLSWLAYFFLCISVEPRLRRKIALDFGLVTPLLSFGAWMTVTNIISPLMVYMDRFFVGVVLSMTAVAYYATPYEIVTKLWIIPGALVSVVFPAFAAALVRDVARTTRLFGQALRYIFLSLFPIILLVVTFAHWLLALWLGDEFANNSSVVLALLSIGIFINSFAHVPVALLQAAGRPDLIAKLHAIELPVFLLALWWALNRFGIEGAAIIWVARVSADTLLLFVIARPHLPSASVFRPAPIALIMAALASFAFAFLVDGLFAKCVYAFVVLLAYSALAWFRVLTFGDKELIADGFRRIANRQPKDQA